MVNCGYWKTNLVDTW